VLLPSPAGEGRKEYALENFPQNAALRWFPYQ